MANDGRSAASLNGPEVESEIALRCTKAPGPVGAGGQRPGAAGKAAQRDPFGAELNLLDRRPQPLNIRIEIGCQAPAEVAKRLDQLDTDHSDRLVSCGQLLGIEAPSPRQAVPQREQDQVDVEPGPILQFDQRTGDIGKGIEIECKVPKCRRRLGKLYVGDRSHHR